MASKNAFAGLAVEEPKGSASATNDDDDDDDNDNGNDGKASSSKKKKNDKKKSKKKDKKKKDREDKARLLMLENEPGYLDTLTAEMKSALAEMKTKFPYPDPAITDHDYLRYLRSKDFNVPLAAAAMKTAEDWRKQYRPMDIPLTDFAFMLEKNLVTHLVGRDRRGRPTIVTRTRLHDKRDSVPAVACELYFKERGIREMLIPGKVESFTYVFDCTGFSLFQADNNFSLIFLKLLKDVYPERTGTIILMNAPWIFSVFWNVIKRWIDPRTSEKIVFLGGDYKEKLKLFIDPSQIPEDIGGTLQFDPKAWVRQELKKIGVDVPANKPIEKPAQYSDVVMAIMKGAPSPSEVEGEINEAAAAEAASTAQHQGDTYNGDDDDDD